MADKTNNSENQHQNKTSGPKPKKPLARGVLPTHQSGAEHVADQVAVKDPDAVQRGIIDVWGWIEDHAKLLALAFVILLLAGIAHVATKAYWDRQEKRAQAAYFPLEAKYTKLKEGYDRAKFKALAPAQAAAAKDEKPDVAASGDFQKDYGTAVPDLDKFAHDYRGTTAGAQAALLAAGTYLEYKQPEKAIELAEIPVKNLGSEHVIAQLSRLLLGSAQATKGDCPVAVKTWQALLDDKNANFLHGEAGLRSGLCYESMNQNDKAMELYRKVSSEGAQSTTGTTAKGLLRALEVKNAKATPTASKAN